MNWTDAVDAGSFATLEEFTTYLRRENGAEVGFESRAALALNAATAFLRSYCARELRSKLWRAPVTMSQIEWVVPGPGSESATLTTNQGVFTGIVRVGDDVFGAQALPYQRVVAVRPSEIDLSYGWSEGQGPIGTYTYVFGSRPLVVSGLGTSDVRVPEWPVTEVISCATWDGAAWIDEDVSDAELSRFAYGTITLPNATIAKGDGNVRLEVVAGYQEPSATTPGHGEEFQVLRRCTLGIALEYFNADATLRGQSYTSRANIPGGEGAGLEMPPAILTMLEPFRRVA